MKKTLLILSMLMLGSCASYNTLYTMDDTSRPNWASEEKASFEDDGKLNFIGVYKVVKTEDLNMNSVKKASELDAWEEVSKEVSNVVYAESEKTSTGLKSEESLNSTTKTITHSLIENAKINGRWYRVIERASDDGMKVMLEYYTKISIDKKDFLSKAKSLQ
jgi:hypothetical protein